MIIALHGFGSSGDKSSTCRMIREHFGTEQRVYTPTYDVTNPFKLSAELRSLINKSPLEPLYIVGISFGGFLARWLANYIKPEIRPVSGVILLNPVLDAEPRLKERLGANKSFVGGEDIVITEDHISAYRAFRVDEDRPGMPISVLVGGKDDIIDPEPTVNYYKGRADVKVIGDADHRFSEHKEEVLDFIDEAINSIHG